MQTKEETEIGTKQLNKTDEQNKQIKDLSSVVTKPEDFHAKEKEIIKRTIENEAEIEQLNKERAAMEKEIRHIKRSKTWKYAKPLRALTKLRQQSEKLSSNQYVEELEMKLAETEKELLQTKEQLASSMLDDRRLNSNQIIDRIRESKRDGTILEYIEETIKDKKTHDQNYKEALTYAARLFMNGPTDQRNLVYSKVLSALKTEDIPEFMVRAGLGEDSIPLKQVASFRGSLTKRIRQQQLVGIQPEFILEDKVDAYQFIDSLGIRKPQIEDRQFHIDDLPQKEGIVVKPADGAGSRGVYLVYAHDDIIDIKRAKPINSWEKMIESMQTDLEIGWVAEDKWIIEELILEDRAKKLPASDLKFYCFYGKVGLILEIKRVPELKYCWWTATGERIRTGKYDNVFKGKGVTIDELAIVSELSSKIPAPFIRIDFLRSHDGLVFGEFTSKPGNYDEFDEKTDEWLGNFYIEAEGRLVNDLLNGKKFKQFDRFVDELNK